MRYIAHKDEEREQLIKEHLREQQKEQANLQKSLEKGMGILLWNVA